MSELENKGDSTEIAAPAANITNPLRERKAARPQDVYRLAVIVEALLDARNDPDALNTIRGELRALLRDLSQTIPDSSN